METDQGAIWNKKLSVCLLLVRHQSHVKPKLRTCFDWKFFKFKKYLQEMAYAEKAFWEGCTAHVLNYDNLVITNIPRKPLWWMDDGTTHVVNQYNAFNLFFETWS